MSKNIENFNLDVLNELNVLNSFNENEIKILDECKMSFPAGIGCGKMTFNDIKNLVEKYAKIN
jgi:hypothetical protein